MREQRLGRLHVDGDVPASSSAVFNVAPPRRIGGPLYIDYDHPRLGVGCSVYIFGYPVRK